LDAPVRQSRIDAVLLVDGQIDHALGLLLLRENGAPLPVWTTQPVSDDLSTGLPILSVLQHYCGIDWHCIPSGGQEFSLPALPGVRLRAMAVEGKPGPYSPHRQSPRSGDNIALVLRNEANGRQAFYAPGLAAVTTAVREQLEACQVILVDGTFWSDTEMIDAGVSRKRAREIGHLPQEGDGGMLQELDKIRAARRILIHINNTNPILDEGSEQHRRVRAAGIEIATDGMDIEL